ncbi:MAG TPA: hypothetical protein VIC06_04975 [Solirubrobacteraceae bacterium]
MTSDIVRGDELIERIFTDGDDGQTSNDLLKEMFDGYPVEKLIPLLRSDDDEIAKAGAFIAEELAAKAAPLMSDLTRLLGHRNRSVRYDILNAVLLATTPNDGEVIAQALTLIHDPERIVRSNALDFLVCADREQLVAGLPHVADRNIAAGLGWLLDAEESPSDDGYVEIESRIDDNDRLVRWFAAVAATRISRRKLDPLNPDSLNLGPLNHAAESSDEELQEFAARQQRALPEELERLQRRLQRARNRKQ